MGATQRSRAGKAWVRAAEGSQRTEARVRPCASQMAAEAAGRRASELCRARSPASVGPEDPLVLGSAELGASAAAPHRALDSGSSCAADRLQPDRRVSGPSPQSTLLGLPVPPGSLETTPPHTRLPKRPVPLTATFPTTPLIALVLSSESFTHPARGAQWCARPGKSERHRGRGGRLSGPQLLGAAGRLHPCRTCLC